MILYPAIDIQKGEAVRLRRGDFSDATVFSADPVERARFWEQEGAQALHVVDLDGARQGRLINFPIVEEIAEVLAIPVEFGGGVRRLEDLQMIASGPVNRVVIGTAAVEDDAFLRQAVELLGDKLVISVDADNGMVATHGWQQKSTVGAVTFSKYLQERGVSHVLYTDIDRDGMMMGMNLHAVKELAQAVDMEIVASGGISKLEDLQRLKELDMPNITSVIVGRALYDGVFTVAEARAILD